MISTPELSTGSIQPDTTKLLLYFHSTLRYLTDYLPSPSTIPVTVSLSVPDRKFLAPEVVLRPEDSMAVVLRKLRSAMEDKGMRVSEFPVCEEFTISIVRYVCRLDVYIVNSVLVLE